MDRANIGVHLLLDEGRFFLRTYRLLQENMGGLPASIWRRATGSTEVSPQDPIVTNLFVVVVVSNLRQVLSSVRYTRTLRQKDPGNP